MGACAHAVKFLRYTRRNSNCAYNILFNLRVPSQTIKTSRRGKNNYKGLLINAKLSSLERDIDNSKMLLQKLQQWQGKERKLKWILTSFQRISNKCKIKKRREAKKELLTRAKLQRENGG